MSPISTSMMLGFRWKPEPKAWEAPIDTLAEAQHLLGLGNGHAAKVDQRRASPGARGRS